MLAAAVLCLVVGVSDGDTLTARCVESGVQTSEKIRIAAIDAPERGQRHYRTARQELARLCYMQEARVRLTDIDRYGRIVADVRCQDEDVAQHMVAAGLAWVYDKHAKGYSYLYLYQEEAQAGQRGLWANKNPVPPWEWRRR